MEKITWAIDPTHSEIGFKVKHMMFTNIAGKFNAYVAGVETNGETLEGADIAFAAEVGSIDTNNADRDNHLKSADFFDAEQFTSLRFKSTEVTKVNDNAFKVAGNMTIKNVTKPIVFDAEYSGMLTDPWGNTKMALSLVGKIDRKEFGLTWNAALETGGLLVGEEVKLSADVQFVKQA